MSSHNTTIPTHHLKQEICATRKPYREGRHPKAVKVYTINNESKYILIQGVPSVGATKNLVDLCSKFGSIEKYHPLDDYPCEDKFTEVYLFMYKRIQSARFAKKKLDDYSFFGGTLHVCYAPEYETVEQTRDKLLDRRKVIAAKIRQFETEQTTPISNIQSSAALDNVQGSTHGADLRSSQQNPSSFNMPPPAETNILPPPPPRVPPLPSSYVDRNTISTQVENSTSASSSIRPPIWDFSQPPPTFVLPLPPKAASFIPHSVRDRKRYESSRVPSAHATLPVGYDGRLEPPSTPTPSVPDTNASNEANFISKSAVTPTAHHQLLPANAGVKTIKSRLDTSTVIVKNYKHSGAVPKFVPRQAVKRIASGSDQEQPAKKIDKLDQEIRKNAFNLGQTQGPEHPNRPVDKPSVPPALDKSVRETINTIRSQISKVIQDTVKNQT